MAEFNKENHALNLPDAYLKTKDSNNYKILEIERYATNDLRKTLEQLNDCLDLNKARGKTLDYYGSTVGQPRGKATDEQYIIMIKAKIMRNLSNGSHSSIVKALCATFSCEPSQVMIKEKDEPCIIEAAILPLDSILKSGLTVSQTEAIVKSMLPVGVSIETFLYEGTFEISATDGVYDEKKGLSDVEGGTMGGILGIVGGIQKDIELPI